MASERIPIGDLVGFLKLSLAASERAAANMRLYVEDQRQSCALTLLLHFVVQRRCRPPLTACASRLQVMFCSLPEEDAHARRQ